MKQIKQIHATITQINPYGEIISSYPLSVSKYNANGHRIYNEQFNESGETEHKVIHQVDERGNILSEVHFDRLTALTERTEYFDTDDDIQYKAEITKTDGSKLTYEFAYNQIGNTDRITIKNEEGTIEAYEHFRYNDNNLVVEEIRTNADSTPQFSKKLFYNDKNILIHEEYYSGISTLTRHVEYLYDTNGLVLEQHDVNEETGATSVSYYFYDEAGNQILDETHHNGVLTFRNECHYDEWDNVIEEKVVQLGSEFNSIEIIKYNIEYWA
jgi:hypothetical protein